MAKKIKDDYVAPQIPNAEQILNERIPKEQFKMSNLNEKISDVKFKGEPVGFLKDAWLRFKRDKMALVASCIILIIVILSIFGPFLSTHEYTDINTKHSLLPPRIPLLEKIGIADGFTEMDIFANDIDDYKDSIVKVVKEYTIQFKGETLKKYIIKVDTYKQQGAEGEYFFFGTDNVGRDLFVRLWRGARISLIIGFVSVLINCFIGVVYGSVSGYYGGKTDMIMQRISEILGGIPYLVMAILFVMVLGAGIWSFILVFIITGWIGMSRMIRGQFYRFKGQEYVLAARTMGVRDRALIFRHILPNAIGPIITQATFAVPGAIFFESFLSYLGLGIQAPEPSIGVLLAEGQSSLTTFPHLVLFPALLIAILMLAFNMFGNGLRDAFDPRMRGL